MIFEPSKGPIIVKDNITVQEDKATVIKAGCVFLFRQFTGIVVNGSLSVEGTIQSPVIFTSYRDEKYAAGAQTPPAEFDWVGIFISPKAGDVSLSNFEVAYSTYGIKSQKEGIILENARFKANGQYNFTIKDKIQDVIVGVPFNYGKKLEEKKETIIKPIEKSAFRKTLPWAVGATGLVTGTAAVVSFIIMADENKDYKNAMDPIEQKDLKKKYNSTCAVGIVCTGLTGICLPLSTFLFIKNNRHVNKSVSLYFSPRSYHEMETGMIMRF